MVVLLEVLGVVGHLEAGAIVVEKVYMNPRSRQLAAFSLDGLPGY